MAIQWQKTYGGTLDEYPRYIFQTNDSGYVVAGYTRSFPSSAYNNFWALKLRSDGSIDSTCLFIGTSDAIALNASGSHSDQNIPPTTPSSLMGVTTTTSAVPTLVNNTITCKFAPAPGTVPDNDNYPGTPLKITKSGTNLVLTWSAPGGTCVTDDYAIYRGTLPWTAYNHSYWTCSTGNVNTYTIPFDVPVDVVSYYYLVVAKSGNKEGSYGLDSSNGQRPAAPLSCYPREIGTCN